MGQYALVAIECHKPESDTDAAVADFLGIKTSGGLRQILHNPFDERCLAATRTACEQNFLVHITAQGSGTARKTTRATQAILPANNRIRK